MSESNTSPSTSHRLAGKRLLTVGLAATAAALVATLLSRFIVGLILPLSPDFLPFTYGSIAFFTTVFCLTGVGIFALINRLARNPLRTFNIVAVVGFFVTLLPDLAGMANPAGFPFPDGSVANFTILILFHVIAAIAFLWTLNSMVKRAG